MPHRLSFSYILALRRLSYRARLPVLIGDGIVCLASAGFVYILGSIDDTIRLGRALEYLSNGLANIYGWLVGSAFEASSLAGLGADNWGDKPLCCSSILDLCNRASLTG